ncbi:cell division protein FtsA [Periweissella cryptocerci]|uniref:cell division protein FtsA n=1 Tax=Periweissella cryptocerci TaxID=2506420 RepID=UPI0024315ECD|nr:cell division protein FtsA [Periweissella cryptocerci]
MTAITSETKRITYDDVQVVAEQAIIQNLPPEREIIDLLPAEFIVDGFDGIKDPYDMVGVRLEMRGIAFTGPKTIVHNIKMAVERAGLKLREFVVAPLAIGRTILTDGEQDFGTVVIDLGAGQATAAVIHDHQLKFAAVDQEGGDYITKDVSTVLNISMADAEKIKRDYGFANPLQASVNNEFPIHPVGKSEATRISEKYLAEIIEARVEQIFTNLFKQLQPTGALDMPGGLVLTGGSAALAGIKELAHQMFGMSVKVMAPTEIGLRHPSYTTGYAVAKLAAQQTMTERVVKQAISGNRLTAVQQDEATQTEPKKRSLFRKNEEKQENDMNTKPSNEEPDLEGEYFDEEPKEKMTDKIKGLFANFFD